MSIPKIAEKIRGSFSTEILSMEEIKDHLVITLRKNKIHDILRFLKEDPEGSCEMLIDLCGVDYLPLGEKPRFEVVYHLFSLTHHHRLRLRVKVDEEDTVLPTSSDLWKSADWFEREAAEMFGFEFKDHPNPRHLLLFEGFEGHPLRKDYPMAKRQRIPVPEENP